MSTGRATELSPFRSVEVNAFVRRTIRLDGPAYARGGVKGSFPVDGTYGQYEYLNWAAKFTVDANLTELDQG